MALHTMVEFRQQYMVRQQARLLCLLGFFACDRAPARSKPWRNLPSAERLAGLDSTPAASLATAKADENAAGNNLVRVAMPAHPGSLLPFVRANVWGARITRGNVFESLLAFAVGQDGALYQPALAESWRFDGQRGEISITVREGVRFHDGAILAIEDVAASLRRGFADEPFARARGVTVDPVDPRQLIIRNADGAILNLVAAIPIVPGATADGKRQPGCAVGTGPYQLSACATEERRAGAMADEVDILLSRFPDYWGEAPEVEKIRFFFVPDPGAMFALGHLGRWDLIPTASARELAFARSRRAIRRHYREANYGAPRFRYAVFNTRREPFDATESRVAVARALFHRAALGGIRAIPLFEESPCLPRMRQVWAQFLSHAAGVSPPWVEGPRSLVVIADPNNSDELGAMAEALSALGWTANPVVLPTNRFVQQLQLGQFDIALVESDLPFTHDLRSFLHTLGRENHGGFSDVATDTWVAQLAQSTTVEQCASAAAALHQRFLETWPLVSFTPGEGVVLIHRRLTDSHPKRDWGALSSLQWSR